MPSRRRLGVALLLEPPVAAEVDGLRRAVGDRALARIASHITLVPPVNVRADSLPGALARLRQAAAASPGALHLTLGPPTSFLPAKPVLLLAVGGDLDGLRRVRDAAFAAPLDRELAWPWVPHVTLADGLPAERIAAAVAALDRYAVPAGVGAVTLLEEVRSPGGPRWLPLADAATGTPIVSGGGSLPLTITRSSLVDPEAAALAHAEEVDVPVGIRAPADTARRQGTVSEETVSEETVSEETVSRQTVSRETVSRQTVSQEVRATTGDPATRPGSGPIVLTCRREAVVVGVGGAWLADDGGHVAVLVARSARRQGVGSQLLARLEDAARLAGWGCPSLSAEGEPAFYLARSRWSVPADAPIT